MSVTHRQRVVQVLSITLAVMPACPAWAFPQGAEVEHGTASLDTAPDGTYQITASDQAIIRWDSFDVASGESVRFLQPSTSASVLNRVTGGRPSDIAGRLAANGLVVLLNAAGIVFAPTASIEVGSLIASSLDLPNQAFLNRQYQFRQPEDMAPAAVVNHGMVRAIEPGGLIALLGGAVANHGTIAAHLGTVALAGGSQITVSFESGGQIAVAVDAPTRALLVGPEGRLHHEVENTGHITADGGTVWLSGSALHQVFDRVVNQTGVIEAVGVEERGGRIFLTGDGDVHLGTGSRLSATGGIGAGRGGEIVVHGHSGTTTVAAGAVVDVSGGAAGGDAGFVELSGATLVLNGQVRGEAQPGSAGGRLLIDPLRLLFNTTTQPSPPNNAAPTPDIAFGDPPAAGTTIIQIADIIGFAEAWFEAAEDITVASPITMNNNNDLVFRAGRHINLNANVRVQGGSGHMTLTADADFSGGGGAASDGVGTIVQALGTSILAGNGTVTLQTGEDFTVRTVTGDGSGTVSITSANGSLLDDGDAATRITAGTLSLTANAAGQGAGTTGALQTDVATLDVNVGSGGAALQDTGSFTVNTPTVAAGGGLNLSADDTLTVAGSASVAVNGTGTLTLAAGADGTGDLTMGAGSSLSSGAGSMTLSGQNLDLRTVTSTSGTIGATATNNARVRNAMTTGAFAGAITVTADSDGSGTGTFIQDGGSSVTTSGGDITIGGSDDITLRTINAGTGDITITGSFGGTDLNDDGDNATKITADALTLTAAGRIGNTGANQLDTSVNTLNASAGNGPLLVTNDQALQVTAASAGGAGNDITIITTTGGLTLGTLTAADDLTLTAAGGISRLAAGSIITGVRLVMTAGSDIGAAAAPLRLNLTSATSSIDAGSGSAHLAWESGNLSVTAQAVAAGVSTLSTSKGTVKTASTGDLTLETADHLTISTDLVSAGTGRQTYVADRDADGVGTFTVSAGKTLTTAGQPVTITARDVALDGLINAGAGDVTLQPSGAGTTIGLGTGAGTLALSDAEVDRIATTGTLTIGNAMAGAIAVDDLTAGATNLALVTAGDINDVDDLGAAITLTGSLTLTAGGSIGTGTTPLDVAVTGGPGTVAAGAAVAGISANVNGMVTPQDTLAVTGTPPGLVLFNGTQVFPVVVPPPEPIQPTASPTSSILRRDFRILHGAIVEFLELLRRSTSRL